jgi:hypothetical protein
MHESISFAAEAEASGYLRLRRIGHNVFPFLVAAALWELVAVDETAGFC